MRKHITINREKDWKQCFLYNLKVENNLVVYKNDKKSNGIFEIGTIITKVIDIGNNGFNWGRLSIETAIPENSTFVVSSYGADKSSISIDGEELEFDLYLKDEKVSQREKISKTNYLFSKSFENFGDGIIKSKGRYLWIKIDFVISKVNEFSLGKIKVFVDLESIINYLPEVYRLEKLDDFFKRYMQIFNTIVFDIEKSIDKISDSLDFVLAEGEVLRYLASFVGIDTRKIANDEIIRRKIRNVCKSTESIGVKENLVWQIKEDFNIDVNIAEFYEIEKMQRTGISKDTYKRLFGNNPYNFFVFVLKEDAERENVNFSDLSRKIREIAPANTVFEIIILKQYITLDEHCYLGINSSVSDYKKVVLTEGNIIFDKTFIGGNSYEE